MATFYDHITDKQAEFIEKQPMFFVASACSEGRINLSPKGMDSFKVLGPNLCGYADLWGSGQETAAHVIGDGRLTFMFNSYDRNPLIVRLYGKGEIVREGHAKYEEYRETFPIYKGFRQFILMHVDSTQDSCGFAVPRMELIETRKTLEKYFDTKPDDEIKRYAESKDTKSIDGFTTVLPID